MIFRSILDKTFFLILISTMLMKHNLILFGTRYIWGGKRKHGEKGTTSVKAEEKRNEKFERAPARTDGIYLSRSSSCSVYFISLSRTGMVRNIVYLSLYDAQIDSFFLSCSLFPHPLSYTLSFPFLRQPCATSRIQIYNWGTPSFKSMRYLLFYHFLWNINYKY